MKIHASLNQLFRLVWSEAFYGWFAIAEQICSRGKDAGRKLVRLAAVMALGRRTANGQVHLINPNGIMFSANAPVIVGVLAFI